MVCIGILYVNALGNRWHHGFLWQMWIYSTHNTLKSFACSWKATKMKWKFRFVNQLASAFATVAVDNIQFSLYCKIWVLLFAFYLQLGVSACSMCICLFEYTYAAFKLFDWHHVMIRKLRSQLSFNPNFLIFFYLKLNACNSNFLCIHRLYWVNWLILKRQLWQILLEGVKVTVYVRSVNCWSLGHFVGEYAEGRALGYVSIKSNKSS